MPPRPLATVYHTLPEIATFIPCIEEIETVVTERIRMKFPWCHLDNGKNFCYNSHKEVLRDPER
jgi:hypothetical protein